MGEKIDTLQLSREASAQAVLLVDREQMSTRENHEKKVNLWRNSRETQISSVGDQGKGDLKMYRTLCG